MTTRFFTAAAIMAAWASYEAAVQKLASFVQGRKGVSLEMSEIRGDFLKRARTYFDDVLKFDLHPLTTDWERLGRLKALRDVLAHTNGVLSDISSAKRRRLDAWLPSVVGLRVVNDEYIVVTAPFAKDAVQFIDSLLTDLAERVNEQF